MLKISEFKFWSGPFQMHIQILWVLSILKFSGIFENCMRGIFYSLKDTLLFKCSEFSEEVYTRCTSRWLSLEYSGIQIRQFTHRPEIKREIPFCTRKRSETYKRRHVWSYFFWEILESQWNRIQQFGRNNSIKKHILSCLFKKHNSWPIHSKSSFLNSAIHKRNEIL